MADKSFSISREQRDHVWEEIQAYFKEKKARDIRVIMNRDDPNDTKADVVKDILNTLEYYEKKTEEWDRFLHCGKTEAEERKERARELAAADSELFKGFKDIFGEPFKSSGFGK